jgi:hypothetical protein
MKVYHEVQYAMMTVMQQKPFLWWRPHWDSPCHDDSTTLEAFVMTTYHKVQYAMMTVMQQKLPFLWWCPHWSSPCHDDSTTSEALVVLTLYPGCACSLSFFKAIYLLSLAVLYLAPLSTFFLHVFSVLCFTLSSTSWNFMVDFLFSLP